MNSRNYGKHYPHPSLFRDDQDFNGSAQVLYDGREINVQGNRERRRKKGDFLEAVADFFTPPASLSGLVADTLSHLSWNGLALVACNLLKIHVGLWWGLGVYVLFYGTYAILFLMLAAADYPNWKGLMLWRGLLLGIATLIVRIW